MSDAGVVASVACLLGDRSRAAMCLAMLDGGCWTVTELAAEASIGMAAASEHLTRLTAGGLVARETQGRHTYVRLAGPRVAELVELLGGFGEPAAPRSLDGVRRRRQLATARTCYDHLAGRLGVAVHDAMIRQRLVHHRSGIGLTARGRGWCTDLGLELDDLETQRRSFLRDCLDLTERTPHLAGSVAAAVCATFLDREWVRRPDRTRALVVTPTGERALRDLLTITPTELAVG